MATQKELQEYMGRIRTKIDSGKNKEAEEDWIEFNDKLCSYGTFSPSQRRDLRESVRKQLWSGDAKREEPNFAALEQRALKNSEKEEHQVLGDSKKRITWK